MNAQPRPVMRSGGVAFLAMVGSAFVMTMCTVGAQGPLVVVLPALLVGAAVATAVLTWRRARADRRDYETRLTRWAATEAVLAERLRIAGDLHDIVSHGLGLITVRAATGSHLARPADMAAALADIEEASRHATAELRRMLTVLREPEAADRRTPLDGLDDLPGIVAGAARAGLRPHLTVEPLGEVSQGVQVAVCRTVREALSNAARHAGPTDVRVTVRRDGEHVVVAVADTGPPGSGWRSTPGAGHGIAGLRERIGSLGGVLLAEPAGAGFRVTARIPDEAP